MTRDNFVLDIFTKSITTTELVRDLKKTKDILRNDENGYIQVIGHNKIEAVLCTPEFFEDILRRVYEIYLQEIKKKYTRQSLNPRLIAEREKAMSSETSELDSLRKLAESNFVTVPELVLCFDSIKNRLEIKDHLFLSRGNGTEMVLCSTKHFSELLDASHKQFMQEVTKKHQSKPFPLPITDIDDEETCTAD